MLRAFAKEVGFNSQDFKGKYDFALSFAGEDRPIARRLCELLSAREVEVFFDENEQHRILAENVEDYLAPIYKTEAAYVVPFLSGHYPPGKYGPNLRAIILKAGLASTPLSPSGLLMRRTASSHPLAGTADCLLTQQRKLSRN